MHIIGVPGGEAASSIQSPRLLDLTMINNVLGVEEYHERANASTLSAPAVHPCHRS